MAAPLPIPPGGRAPMPILNVAMDPFAPPAPQPGADLAFAVLWRGETVVGRDFVVPDADGRLDEAALRALIDPVAWDRAPPAAPEGAEASVVICTRDRPGELGRCLDALRGQTLAPAEIVVVDNAPSDDRTRRVAEEAGARWVLEPRPGLDIARNAGARATRAPILAYTDDDVRQHPRWLERLVAAFERPEIMAATGLVLPLELETCAQQAFEHRWSFSRGLRPREFGPGGDAPGWAVGAGASMAFRREAFDRVGWFDERLDMGAAGCSGDSEFWRRLIAAGWVCRYEPTAIAWHVHRRDMAGLRRQIRDYASGAAAATLVQFERERRWRDLAELARTGANMLGRAAERLARGVNGRNLCVWDEVRGLGRGIAYYLQAPRPRA